MKSIIVREASAQDYPAFLTLEQAIWAEADLAVIDQETFTAWTETHRSGCLLAFDEQGSLVGHTYAQICHFDPSQPESARQNFDQVTGGGDTRSTHNTRASCLYMVNLCSRQRGAGSQLTRTLVDLSLKRGLTYISGSCRLSGLHVYCRDHNLQAERTVVWDYVERHNKTHPQPLAPEYRDPVLSMFLKQPHMRAYDIVPNFLAPLYDWQSMGWACVYGRPLFN